MGTSSGVQVPCGSDDRNDKPKATASREAGWEGSRRRTRGPRNTNRVDGGAVGASKQRVREFLSKGSLVAALDVSSRAPEHPNVDGMWTTELRSWLHNRWPEVPNNPRWDACRTRPTEGSRANRGDSSVGSAIPRDPSGVGFLRRNGGSRSRSTRKRASVPRIACGRSHRGAGASRGSGESVK